MAGLDNYDQWKTASPYDDERDIVQDAEDLAKEVRRARLEWDTKPGAWGLYIDKLLAMVDDLTTYVEENT